MPSFLLALALAAPCRADVPLPRALPSWSALGALRFLPAPGLELGSYFDGAAATGAVLAAAPAAAATEGPAARRLLAKPGKDRYDPFIRAEAERKGLDPRLVKSVIAAESEFTVRARSRAGARGLMQVMPATADSVGVSGRLLYDPIANIRAGTRYLAWLFARAWERYHLKGVPFAKAPAWLVARVIAAYNAGPRWVRRRAVFRQTREYVRKVLAFYRSAVSELRAEA